MPYMAVGSRQILFADSYAPAQTGESVATVAALEDNRPEAASAAVSRTVEPTPADPTNPVGGRVDVTA